MAPILIRVNQSASSSMQNFDDALFYLTCAKGSFVVKVGCRQIDIYGNQIDFVRNVQFTLFAYMFCTLLTALEIFTIY